VSGTLIFTTPAPPSLVVEDFQIRHDNAQAVQVTLENLRLIVAWIRDNGGARTGLHWRDQGPIEGRFITVTGIGTMVDAHIGDWILRSPDGAFTVMIEETFRSLFHVP
jgi:hypothetical protein